jgi:Family of unknown function (DUF6152)
MKLKAMLLAAVAIVSLTWSAWAHHAHSNYDTNSFTLLEGTVKQLRWMNPHTWILLEVNDNGKTAVWQLEGGSPNALTREGWKKEDVPVGAKVKVRCHPLKDGANGCLMGFITVGDHIDKEFD